MDIGDLALDLRNDDEVLIVGMLDETAGELEEFTYDYRGDPVSLAEYAESDEEEAVYVVLYTSKLDKIEEGWRELSVNDLEYPERHEYYFVESDLEVTEENFLDFDEPEGEESN